MHQQKTSNRSERGGLERGTRHQSMAFGAFSCCALFSSEELAGDTEHLKALDVSEAWNTGDQRVFCAQGECTQVEMAPAATAAALCCLFICPRNTFFQNLAIGERPATKPTSFFCLFALSPREFAHFVSRDAKTQKRLPPREMLQAVAHCCCVGSFSDGHLSCIYV